MGDLVNSDGIVIAIKANYYYVEVNYEKGTSKKNILSTRELEKKIFFCTARRRLKHIGVFINVGDFVSLEHIDFVHMTAVINDVRTRKSWLARPAVANVSNVVVTLAHKNPSFDFEQACRFLLTAENTGILVDVLLTKKDLVTNSEHQKQLARINAWGYKPFSVSVKTGEGLKEFQTHVSKSRLSVVCGPSGVGKSSLLNKLKLWNDLRVGSLSSKINLGKHTTRHVELFSLSRESRIADTPGFNRPELYVEPVKIGSLFPELRSQLIEHYPCKFRDCLHKDEPGCGINKDWERYPFYKSFVDEMINLSFQRQGD